MTATVTDILRHAQRTLAAAETFEERVSRPPIEEQPNHKLAAQAAQVKVSLRRALGDISVLAEMVLTPPRAAAPAPAPAPPALPAPVEPPAERPFVKGDRVLIRFTESYALEGVVKYTYETSGVGQGLAVDTKIGERSVPASKCKRL